MRQVKIIQTHMATIKQIDAYEMDDDAFETMTEKSGDEREFYIMENGTATNSDTEIGEIHGTIDVEFDWSPPLENDDANTNGD